MKIRRLDITVDLSHVIRLDAYLNGERPAAVIEKEYGNYHGDIFVGETDSDLIGLTSLSTERWNRVAIIDHLAVDEGHRGRGLGSKLLSFVTDIATSHGTRIICVQTAT